ncbi:MAG: hypothetical protein WBP10_16250 [Thermoanaerobaculia bacterium]|jgi:hypothetical protein
MRWTSQLPDPSHFWIGLAPRSWPGEEGLWVDLGRGGLGASSKAATEIPDEWRTQPPDEVVYLPPVRQVLESQRSHLVGSLMELGVPVVVQRPVEAGPVVDPDSVVFDPLEALLAGKMEYLAELPAGAKVVWPLVAGLTDDRTQWEEGLAALAAAGVEHVQPMALDLEPADKRRLVERAGQAAFHALFHGEQPSENLFSCLAAARGFGPFLPRPLPSAGVRRENQRLGEQLAIAGELWLRVGRSESGGQDLYRSARWVDRDNHDLPALCREGNLGVFPWLDPLSSRVITDFVTTGTATLVQDLKEEYLGSLA